MGPDTDRAYLDHTLGRPWLAKSCTCRTRPDGKRYYICATNTAPGTRTCDREGQACGGYCRSCFTELMDRARLKAETKIVTLCGSTRFPEAFAAASRKLGLEGVVVLSVSMFGHSGDLTPEECEDGHPTKTMLDELHKRKIDLSDEILVLNVGGYIGTSTRSEIDYAERWGVPVNYLEPAPVPEPSEGDDR